MRGTIQAPAADAIAAEHAHPPACHQLNYPICGESRCSAARCYARPPAAAFVPGRHGRGRPGASGPAGRARRPDTIIRRREREVRPRHGA